MPDDAPSRAGLGIVAAIAVVLSLTGYRAVRGEAPPSPATLAACAACHGPNGNATDASMPSLAAQPKLFIENQLVLIREGLREIPQMKAVMTGMSDQQIIALAMHYAARAIEPKPLPREPDKVRAGAALAREKLCGTCHLADFVGQQQVPRLSGQNEPYLMQSMLQFRDNPGPGRDTIMAAALYGLNDTELASLAHYLSGLDP